MKCPPATWTKRSPSTPWWRTAASSTVGWSTACIFRGVKIAKGATVKNCVIMQDARIDEGVYLENCILDKQAHIQKDGRLIGPKSYPIVLSKNMVI